MVAIIIKGQPRTNGQEGKENNALHRTAHKVRRPVKADVRRMRQKGDGMLGLLWLIAFGAFSFGAFQSAFKKGRSVGARIALAILGLVLAGIALMGLA